MQKISKSSQKMPFVWKKHSIFVTLLGDRLIGQDCPRPALEQKEKINFIVLSN
ncbi:MAG: hypothetical protein IKH25_08085 [Muribaculaceae bacterium]|nr:hypothetical protein [Muribaculaceae bacterium]